jgi:hypothetical protein
MRSSLVGFSNYVVGSNNSLPQEGYTPAPQVVSDTEWVRAIRDIHAEESPTGIEQDDPFLWWRQHDEYPVAVAL